MGGRSELVDEALPQALGRLRVALEDAYLRASRELGLSPPQAELLCAAMGSASVGELAKALRCDRSNVSRLVDRASMRGLIKRRGGEDDGRVTVVELTAEGERTARRFLTSLQSQTEGIRAEWPRQHQQLAVELLDGISNALDAARYQPERRRRRPNRDKEARATAGAAKPRSHPGTQVAGRRRI